MNVRDPSRAREQPASLRSVTLAAPILFGNHVETRHGVPVHGTAIGRIP